MTSQIHKGSSVNQKQMWNAKSICTVLLKTIYSLPSFPVFVSSASIPVTACHCRKARKKKWRSDINFVHLLTRLVKLDRTWYNHAEVYETLNTCPCYVRGLKTILLRYKIGNEQLVSDQCNFTNHRKKKTMAISNVIVLTYHFLTWVKVP